MGAPAELRRIPCQIGCTGCWARTLLAEGRHTKSSKRNVLAVQREIDAINSRRLFKLAFTSFRLSMSHVKPRDGKVSCNLLLCVALDYNSVAFGSMVPASHAEPLYSWRCRNLML